MKKESGGDLRRAIVASIATVVLASSLAGLAACGGGGGYGGGGGGGGMSNYGAPVITAQPQSASVASGQSASFAVSASGSGLTYQWMKNSIDIAGATMPTYETPPATTADNNAQFAVRVSNMYGSVVSSHVSLMVM
jgi:hypothetical protein